MTSPWTSASHHIICPIKYSML